MFRFIDPDSTTLLGLAARWARALGVAAALCVAVVRLDGAGAEQPLVMETTLRQRNVQVPLAPREWPQTSCRRTRRVPLLAMRGGAPASCVARGARQRAWPTLPLPSPAATHALAQVSNLIGHNTNLATGLEHEAGECVCRSVRALH